MSENAEILCIHLQTQKLLAIAYELTQKCFVLSADRRFYVEKNFS